MANAKKDPKKDNLIENPSRKMQAYKNKQIVSRTREKVLEESKEPLD